MESPPRSPRILSRPARPQMASRPVVPVRESGPDVPLIRHLGPASSAPASAGTRDVATRTTSRARPSIRIALTRLARVTKRSSRVPHGSAGTLHLLAVDVHNGVGILAHANWRFAEAGSASAVVQGTKASHEVAPRRNGDRVCAVGANDDRGRVWNGALRPSSYGDRPPQRPRCPDRPSDGVEMSGDGRFAG